MLMNKKEHERLLRLQKRANWLRERISKGGDKSFDEAELSALDWAINKIIECSCGSDAVT